MKVRYIDFEKLRGESQHDKLDDVINIIELMNLHVQEDPEKPDAKNDPIRHLMKDVR